MTATRDDVIREALTWEGTPYHHRAMIKGVGADCAMFPLAVYSSLGLIEPIVAPPYSAQWHLNGAGTEIYLNLVNDVARPIAEADAGPGDFVIWRFGRTFSHGAIILDPPQIIHATIVGGSVHRGDMNRDDDLGTRQRRFYTVWD